MINLSNLIPLYINPKELSRIESIFQKIGFKTIFLQEWKEKQVIGLAKDVTQEEIYILTNDKKAFKKYPRCQWHLRGYENGKLEMEIELHRNDLRHIWSTRPSAHEELAKILSGSGISYSKGSQDGSLDSFESLTNFHPDGEIDWKAILTVAGIGILLLALFRESSASLQS